MNREKRFFVGLLINGIIYFIFITYLSITLELPWLLIFLIQFFTLWLLFFISHKVWNFWYHPIMQLTNYIQLLNEGDDNFSCDIAKQKDLLGKLAQQINLLANSSKNTTDADIVNGISQAMSTWNQPIFLFDAELKLIYVNQAAITLMRKPLLAGSYYKDLNFYWYKNQLKNKFFDKNWQCQTTKYSNKECPLYLFSAVNITASLNEIELSTQQNLVRVLSHEIRNSITPMVSMSQTLLSMEVLDPQQVKKVLARIATRGERLLKFIKQYAELSTLPSPHLEYFDLSKLIIETINTLPFQLEVEYKGINTCYADQTLFSHLLLNLLKNATEAQSKKVVIRLYIEENNQHLIIEDNGTGFKSLDNILTPFYTTKDNGSGVGMILCSEIMRLHHGLLRVSNKQGCGASVGLVWPLLS